MSDSRIHNSLQQVFQRHRLVFWYDATGEWVETFNGYPDESVVKLTVAGNEFGTKVRIVRDPNPDAKFLIYVPTARPADADNWLLDLLLQGYEYKADKASLALQEVGLPHEFLHLAEAHGKYFHSAKRVQALKEMIGRDDQSREIRLKMMAVLADTDVEVDAMLLRFLRTDPEADLIATDRVDECLGAAALAEPFWQEVERLFGYTAAVPSLRDFAVSLFRGANPLDTQAALHPHAKVFLQRWKDSQTHSLWFRDWAHQMEKELQIVAALGGLDERKTLGDCDTFEIFEKFTLHRLCQSFANGAAAMDLRAVVQQRRGSIWWPQHEHGYAALEQAVELRELLAGAELTMDSVTSGVSRYVTTWWRIDMAYRLCTWNLRRYGQVQVMEQISQWVEKSYVNNFLLPLADRWSDQVRGMESWGCSDVIAQRRFFSHYVQPFLTKGQKVFVIISDALRYEAASDFAQRLRSANRWTAEVEALFGSLPSYTQLGMAALLPGQQLTVDAITATVTVDGRGATGTANRREILSLACDGKATAIQAEEFLELNTKTEGRALMRDHEVIYIFHNIIDKTGDAAGTEAKTFDAVEQAFAELDLIIKKVANINGSNMLLTADHGFLFQQDDVAKDDATPLPTAGEWTFRNRRFALGLDIPPNAKVKIFDSTELGLAGDWSAAFPLSLGRFPLQGSGMRYVHGGSSLQEVVVPVVKIHKARADDTDKVEIELLRVPAKITTGQLSIALFQDRPAQGKVLPRTLRVGIFAKDGTSLSEIKTHTFDSKESEARQRETTLLLVLSAAADTFNNREVDLRLEETVSGTIQIVTYKTHSLKLQKPFTSDFDEH
ncbi:BREX-1 system phosphatase PglZ type A [Prosthecobacter sp.]|uniref:BREX-1 system phosphatase PglZ type A n=1 Tax=Prosthecobacter sp. TaxID=1965333 RepID=UPI002ABC8274|nr:BREX-1 system phosphatase PglZ type A [Prosthecobacter sp.]MDZ4405300.1 BREX-1 system phosphatase PglZ type A [Prosthecobacter sp.]